jgi:hypothetical protein
MRNLMLENLESIAFTDLAWALVAALELLLPFSLFWPFHHLLIQ